MKHINHLTINTGHVRRSPKSEAPDDVTRRLLPTILAALKGSRVKVTGTDCTMTAGATGTALSVAVYGRPVNETENPLILFTVATDKESSKIAWDGLWHVAPGMVPGIQKIDIPPAPPWISVLVCAGFMMELDFASMAGDFERCVAWAWINYCKKNVD